MTCADPFTRASQTYLPAAATSVRPHAVLQIGRRGPTLTVQFLITMAALAMFVASIAFIVEQVK